MGSTPLVVVIPAYNEEENLPRLFADLEARPELFPADTRIIIVDDGSTDGSAALVSGYGGPLPVELFAQGRNRGPGAAFRAGFRAALETCPPDGLVATLEADTTSDLEALAAMIERADGGTDLVLASVHGGGRMVNVSWLRRTLSRCAGSVTRRVLGLNAHTVSSFFRVYRADALRRGFARYGDNLISETGFACKAEILAKLAGLGCSVCEIPVDLDGSRRRGHSKMRLLPTLMGYWRLVLHGRRPAGPEGT